jgi:hypothetical protein
MFHDIHSAARASSCSLRRAALNAEQWNRPPDAQRYQFGAAAAAGATDDQLLRERAIYRLHRAVEKIIEHRRRQGALDNRH